MSAEELYAAVGAGALLRVKTLLAKGADPNYVSKSDGGATPLMSASADGRGMLVRILIDAGAEINAQGSDRCSALYWACHFGNVDVVKLLLQRGADPLLETSSKGPLGTTFAPSVTLERKMEVQDIVKKAKEELGVPTPDSQKDSQSSPPPIPKPINSTKPNRQKSSCESNGSLGIKSPKSTTTEAEISKVLEAQDRRKKPLVQLYPERKSEEGRISKDKRSQKVDLIGSQLIPLKSVGGNQKQLAQQKPSLLCGGTGSMFKRCFCSDALGDVLGNVEEFEDAVSDTESAIEMEVSNSGDKESQTLREAMKKSGSLALRQSISNTTSSHYRERGVLYVEGPDEEIPPDHTTIFDFTAPTINEVMLPLEVFSSFSVMLIVNVASQCGYAHSNYHQLQALHEKYHGKGLEILAFPCNQFAKQEPWPNLQIKEYITKKYKITFPVFAKVMVNGHSAHPLFAFLKEKMEVPHIMWNFTKFLVVNGLPIKVYAHNLSPEVIEGDICDVFTILESRKGQDSADVCPKFY